MGRPVGVFLSSRPARPSAKVHIRPTGESQAQLGGYRARERTGTAKRALVQRVVVWVREGWPGSESPFPRTKQGATPIDRETGRHRPGRRRPHHTGHPDLRVRCLCVAIIQGEPPRPKLFLSAGSPSALGLWDRLWDDTPHGSESIVKKASVLIPPPPPITIPGLPRIVSQDLLI